MRTLTDRQSLVLEQISNSPAAGKVKVVGWADDCPILKTGHGHIVLLRPDGGLKRAQRI